MLVFFAKIGGEGGIRTHGTREEYNGFRDRPDRPLWHLSAADTSAGPARAQLGARTCAPIFRGFGMNQRTLGDGLAPVRIRRQGRVWRFSAGQPSKATRYELSL